MRFGSTLALLGVAGALGGYVYFIEVGGEPARQEAETAKKRLVDFPRESVTALEIPLEGGSRARVTRGQGADGKAEWKLVEPLSYLAEEPSVSALLMGFERLEFETKVESPPADLSKIGLDDDKRVKFEVKEGEPLLVTLGSDTPVGGQRFVRLEGRRTGVYAVRKAQTEGLSTSLYKLRDKRVETMDPREVQSVSVKAKGKLVVRAERKADSSEAKAAEAKGEPAPPQQWSVREPVEDPGDSDRIARLVQDLYFARANAFVDQVGDLKNYGLQAPEVEVELVAKGDVRQQLRIGKNGGKVYLQVGDKAPVYEVAARTLDNLPLDPFAYRFKRVLAIPETGARQVDVLFPRDGKQFVFKRADDEDKWKPESDDLKLQSPGGQVDDLLFDLYTVDAAAALEKPERAALGLEPPILRVTVRGADAKELGWIEFGDPGPDGIPAGSSQSDRLWRVKAELGDHAPLGLDAFRARWQQAPAEEPATDAKPAADEAPAAPPAPPAAAGAASAPAKP